MKLRFCLWFFACLLALQAAAQAPTPVRGLVLDAATGQPLPGVVVRVRNAADAGTVTDADGRFNLPLPANARGLVLELVGYKPQAVAIPTSDKPLTIRLGALAVRLHDAEVIGKAGQADPENHLRGGQMGETILTMESLRVLPVLFGETDPVKTLALLPGVQTGGEGQTGLYVRGGGQDQNLVLYDGVPVYNAGHLLNFFSVFNADAIATASLLKTPGANYGGRLSSVLAVEGRDGARDSLHARAGIGLIASRLLVEGPLGRRPDSGAVRPGSFLLSGRRTYLDVLAKPFQKDQTSGVPYYFYDLNGRLAWRFGDRDRLTLSAYHGRDDGRFTLAGGRLKANFFWGNAAASLRWRHEFSPKLRLHATTTVADYQFSFTTRFDGYESRLLTYVRDYGGSTWLEYTPVPRHHITVGIWGTNHTLRPRAGDAEADNGQTFTTSRVQTKYAQEGAAWLTDDWNLTEAVLFSAGLRASGLRQRGPYTRYWFDDGARVTDSVHYADHTTVARFGALEPRVAVRWALNGRTSLKAAYGESTQYLHLVSQATSALPLDVWVPASALTPPQRGRQWSAGWFRTLGPQQEWEISAEAYYRQLANQLEYRDGYAPGPSNRDAEYEFVSGRGRAWGLELLARKQEGRFSGWIAYTLAWAKRQFPALNNGVTYPYRFDQRHNLNVVASYSLNPHWQFGGTFVYATGQAITMPERRYLIGNNVQFQYGARNAFRMQAQHRLDLSATWQRPPHGQWRQRWQFSVYNVYSRRNPWFYYLQPEGDVLSAQGKVVARKVSIFPYPVPAVTWEVSF